MSGLATPGGWWLLDSLVRIFVVWHVAYLVSHLALVTWGWLRLWRPDRS